MDKNETQEQILIRRVFNHIAESHFNDHKMSPHYCNIEAFPRGLGDDIANYVQAHNPEMYHKQKRIWLTPTKIGEVAESGL